MAKSNVTQIALLKRQIESLKKQKETIKYYNLQAEESRLAWCVDLGDITVGSIVGTIEVDRELQGLNIKPAFGSGAPYVVADDGITMYFGVMNPYLQFFNAIVEPSASSFRPRYRYGEAYDINYDSDTCSVNLRPYTSKLYPKTELNKSENLYGVKITYMDCNSEPFSEGDIVTVKFENRKYGSAEVVGFKSEPKPCGTDEIVYLRFGPLGILWDVKTNTFVEGYSGTQAFATCEAYVSSKVETTLYDPESIATDMPYKKMLWTLALEAGQADFPRYRATTWGLPANGEIPGYMYDRNEDPTVIVSHPTYQERTTVVYPATCPWGILSPGYTKIFRYMYIPSGYALIYHYSLIDWSSWDYAGDAITCPVDVDPANLSYGTEDPYGNDLPAIGYPGCVLSESTIVQTVFSSHALYEFPVTGYLSPRETVAYSTCGTYPWEVAPDAYESDPQLMEMNEDFNTAIVQLIEDLHSLWGVEILKDSPYYDWGHACVEPEGDVFEQCEDGLCDYWFNVLTPQLEIKIYRKN